jgi:hypothetical protein
MAALNAEAEAELDALEVVERERQVPCPTFARAPALMRRRAGRGEVARACLPNTRCKTAPAWCSLGCRSRCDGGIHV